MTTDPTTSSNRINLRRLLSLRLIILFAELFAAWVAVSRWHVDLNLSALAAIWLTVASIAVLTFIRLRLHQPVSNPELFMQLNVEVVALTAALYVTGGSTNPFAPFYLLPLTLTAVALPGAYVWAMLGLTVSCYTLLLFFYLPVPAVHGGHGGDFRLHELGMWSGFLLSAGLIAAFAGAMASTVRRRDRQIAGMREQKLRDERVLALGTLAAGAAHELGTPLSTLAILLKDQQPGSELDAGKLEILRQQVSRCKQILGSVSAAAGETRAESGGVQHPGDYLRELLANWRTSRPDVELRLRLDGNRKSPRVVLDQTLGQAILNVVNNAADVSPADVEVHASWNEDELNIEVADRGPGLSPQVADRAGTTIVSTKQDGLGLGLFLSYTTLQRLGGEVRLHEREGGGTLCRIYLRLDNLKVQ